jgi:hypothetical protein
MDAERPLIASVGRRVGDAVHAKSAFLMGAMSLAIDELRIAKRAAAIYFWLGVAVVLTVVSGETITLLLYMIGFYFWVFVAWAACAAYASYLSWRHTSRTSLRVLSILAFCHLAFAVAYPGVPLPWGGSFGVGPVSEAVGVFCRLGWIATALAMVVLAFFDHRRVKKLALAKPTSQSTPG